MNQLARRDGDGEHAVAIRLLIVDQYDLYRLSLASLLASHEDLEVVAQAPEGKMGISLAAELRPDVVLMDPRLPDLDGAAAAQAILQQDRSVRLVAISSLADESDVASALRAGFCGYLLKDAPIDEVVAAIRAAARGAPWLAPRDAQAVLERFNPADGDGHQAPVSMNGLSPREVEVLRILARGCDNDEIAAALAVSPQTATNYVASILGKLGLAAGRTPSPP